MSSRSIESADTICCLPQALAAARLAVETAARHAAEERVVIMEAAFGEATELLTVRVWTVAVVLSIVLTLVMKLQRAMR